MAGYKRPDRYLARHNVFVKMGNRAANGLFSGENARECDGRCATDEGGGDFPRPVQERTVDPEAQRNGIERKNGPHDPPPHGRVPQLNGVLQALLRQP